MTRQSVSRLLAIGIITIPLVMYVVADGQAQHQLLDTDPTAYLATQRALYHKDAWVIPAVVIFVGLYAVTTIISTATDLIEAIIRRVLSSRSAPPPTN